MNTYLPYKDFADCAQALSAEDLGTSIVAAVNILDCIHETTSPEVGIIFDRLPVTRMWRGREVFLIQYAETLMKEWVARDNADIDLSEYEVHLAKHMEYATSGDFSMEPPRWLGDDNLHDAHKAELVRSDPPEYFSLWHDVPLDKPMFWPVA